MKFQKESKRIRKRAEKVFLPMLAGVLLWVTQFLCVRADVIWEPYENDFYKEHYEECTYVGVDYTANGSEGYVTVYQAPDSSKEIALVLNGETLFVSFSWQDKKGNDWGAVEIRPENTAESRRDVNTEISQGWVRMSEMAKKYNEKDFRSEHEHEFEEYQGELDNYVIEKSIVIWPYPGADEYKDEILFYMSEGEVPGYQDLYTDPDGNRWTYVGYYYGSRQGWVCIDAPEAKELLVSYEEEETEQVLYPAKEPEEGLNSGQDNIPGMKLAAALVAFTVVLTAGLIAALFGKKRRK